VFWTTYIGILLTFDCMLDSVAKTITLKKI